MKNRIIVLSLILIGALILGSCNQEKDDLKSNRFESIFQTEFPNHFPQNTVDAFLLREIINDYVTEKDTNELQVYIKHILKNEIFPLDSVVYNRILNRIDTDERLVKNCDYLKKVLTCDEKYESRHFNVYNLNSKVNQEEIRLYDKQFDELKMVFHNTDTMKLNIILDTTLSYWRAFPAWNVKYGLLQRYINGNPHELVHHFFTKYSDVPFFHEPLAFLYGDYSNDTTKFYNEFTTLNEQLSTNEYLRAKEVWHFPAIVTLEKHEKLSFWLFTSTLMQKYGIEKFIEFASLTTWDKNNGDFEKNFNTVYSISLNEFEQNQIIRKLIK
ncbi:hypothetical protein HNS38_18850 [Lentimicrobium sp. L6]|uniref:hypothetical protein n=1 Tax=Lentimicrobium sp. L6 TaxID=2735916 RepID=UPI00155511A0|nr:hypothetical protein [Lentimicrobium sp. L6]NPD86829.1 hypothetical protein [Lentimicrobium sp. L6]